MNLFRKVYFWMFLSIIAAAVWAGLTISLKANLNWDEAFHLYWSYQIYRALNILDLNQFIKITLDQTFYPPLQSWLLALPALFGGFTIGKARLYWLFWFILSAIFIYFLSKKAVKGICKKDKIAEIAGIFATLFYITSPLVLYLSSIAIKETMGAGLSLIIAFTYFKAKKEKRRKYFILLGLELFVLTMGKYNYGLLMLIILSVEVLFSLIFLTGKEESIKNYLFMIGIYSILLFTWLIYPFSNLNRFIEVIQNGVSAYQNMSSNVWHYRLFYLNGLLFIYPLSPFFGYFLILSFFIAIKWWKNYLLRFSLFTIIINFILASAASWNMQERYIFISFPFWCIVSGVTVANGFRFIQNTLKNGNYRRFVYIVIIAIVCYTGRNFIKLENLVYSTAAYTYKSPVFNQSDYRDVFFEYNRNRWPQKSLLTYKGSPIEVVDWILDQINLDKPVSIIGQAAELAPDFFNLEIARRRDSGEYSKKRENKSFTVILEIIEGGYLDNYDFRYFNSYMLPYVKGKKIEKGLQIINNHLFIKQGVEVTILGEV